ncbi:hypothetical protein ACOMHN_030288 [Nucella lapillus]
MVSGDNVTVTLTGGSPWGFRLTGGGSLPLQIAKIRKKSQAHARGLQEGDAVVSINGTPVHDRSHDEAVDLIDAAGDTLTLQIYRGESDDLGQLLASSRPHAPLLPPGAEGQGQVTVTSSTSTSADGGTRRQVQQKVFVTSDGGKENTTFVRREHTTTTSSSGDVNGNDVSRSSMSQQFRVSSTSFESSSSTSAPAPPPQGAVLSLSPKPPAVSPKPSSPRPSVSPKPVSPAPFATAQLVVNTQSVSTQPPQQIIAPTTWAPKPTFKAVPPKAAPPSLAPKPAPAVAPKPAPAVAPKPQAPTRPTFNAKAATAAPMFAPQKFQASATAMTYSSQPQAAFSSPGGPQSHPQQSAGGGQFHPMQAKYQPQAFSPGSGSYPPGSKIQQINHFSPGGGGGGGGGSQQPFSPMSISSPLSPASQPFSHMSPGGGGAPMFNVRNNVNEGPQVWSANMWLPGQEPGDKPRGQPQQPPQQQQQPPQQQQQQQQGYPPPEAHNEHIEVPKRMTIKERQQMLLNQTAKAPHHSLMARQADPEFDAPPEEVQRIISHKLFGPPVEMTPEGPYDMDMDSDGSSHDGSSVHRRKNLYADSAFYADPMHKYPTIEEQMKLCRLISTSLTSAANRRARGAKMFAKRKRKSSKWVHEGHSEFSSSTGDVANIEDLESELNTEEGGNKQLFMFRIPNLKQRIASPERNTKMSMKKDEFERMRLQAMKCDHRTVSPGTCFDIAADLKAHKGRGGRMFERRKNRSDKFIIDESNAKMPGPKHTKLEDIIGRAPLKSSKSPWQAAQEGSVDSAFEHLSDMERMQKMNQILKYTPPKPAVPQPTREVLQPLQVPQGPRSDLRTSSTLPLLQGRDFNRLAKGWCSSGTDSLDRAGPMASQHAAAPLPPATAQDYPVEAAAPRGQNRVHFGDYNPRPRAWQTSGPAAEPSSYSCPPSMSASWASSDFDSTYPPQHNHAGAGAASHSLYSPSNELPASDL